MASEPLAIANPGLHRQESGLDIAKIASAYDTRPQESGTKDGSELSEENPWEKNTLAVECHSENRGFSLRVSTR